MLSIYRAECRPCVCLALLSFHAAPPIEIQLHPGRRRRQSLTRLLHTPTPIHSESPLSFFIPPRSRLHFHISNTEATPRRHFHPYIHLENHHHHHHYPCLVFPISSYHHFTRSRRMYTSTSLSNEIRRKRNEETETREIGTIPDMTGSIGL